MWALTFAVSSRALGILLAILAELLPDIFILGPLSDRLLDRRLGISDDLFTKYVSCGSCHSVYAFADCFERKNGAVTPLKCRHVAFPEHPHVRQRDPCGANLLRKVKTSRGDKYVPICTFAYNSIKQRLVDLMNQPTFAFQTEQWRKRRMPVGILGDVFDGHQWARFQEVEGRPFLSAPNNLALSLNLDWFQVSVDRGQLTSLLFSHSAMYSIPWAFSTSLF